MDSTEQTIILPQSVSTRLSDYGQIFDCPTKVPRSCLWHWTKEQIIPEFISEWVKKIRIRWLHFKEKLRLLQRSWADRCCSSDAASWPWCDQWFWEDLGSWSRSRGRGPLSGSSWPQIQATAAACRRHAAPQLLAGLSMSYRVGHWKKTGLPN